MGVLPRLLRSSLRDGQHRRRAVHAAKALRLLAVLRMVAALGLATALACVAHAAAAQTSAPVAESRTEIQAALPTAWPAGSGRLRVWGFEVYDASLWVAPGFRQGSFAEHA